MKGTQCKLRANGNLNVRIMDFVLIVIQTMLKPFPFATASFFVGTRHFFCRGRVRFCHGTKIQFLLWLGRRLPACVCVRAFPGRLLKSRDPHVENGERVCRFLELVCSKTAFVFDVLPLLQAGLADVKSLQWWPKRTDPQQPKDSKRILNIAKELFAIDVDGRW